MTRTRGSGTAGVFGVIVVLVGLAWLSAVFILPYYKMDYADERIHRDAMNRVSAEMQFHLSDASSTVLVPMRDDGLDIFLTRSSFESVPYPDRDNFTLAVADLWCGNISSGFLPSVRFRDIRSGKVLTRHLCEFHSAPDPTGSYSGVVHNKTADLDATFSVQMVAPNDAVHGCMQVATPLFGTGPIVGTLNGRKFQFDLNNPGMHIRFDGLRDGLTVRGTYVVTGNANGPQTGEFTLHQDSIRVMVPNGSDLDHCPRD
jgi:hypothetical protein